MTNYKEKNLEAFIQLADILKDSLPANILYEAESANPFFTPEDVSKATKALAYDMLQEDKLRSWLPHFTPKYKSCLIIMAGNIPLVGFFDLMCCMLIGVECYVKPSSKDKVLMLWLIEQLKALGAEGLHVWNGTTKAESVIATGSNNASRYFTDNYTDIPTVIRGSRSSVALLDGTETIEEWDGLWNDMFSYYGLGCRSVSHLVFPDGYDPSPLFKHLASKKIHNPHYLGAYKQNRAIKIINKEKFFDGGFFTATQSNALSPALGEVFYNHVSNMIVKIQSRNDLQCIVGHGHLPFGSSQHPTLNDWADDINLFHFFGATI